MIIVTRPVLAGLALALALSACGNLGAPVPRAALFDLGEPAVLDVPAPSVPVRIEARAPAWLSTPDMQYRLDYQQPARRDAYAQSRWVAPPAEMVGHVLERTLVGNGVATAECVLRIEVDEFVQVFGAPHASEAVLATRVTLLPVRSDTALAREIFRVREPAPSADAEGGVIAHRQAVARLGHELAVWLAALDRDGGQGLNTGGRCRR